MIDIKLPKMDRRMAKLARKARLKKPEVTRIALPRAKAARLSVVSALVSKTKLKKRDASKRVPASRKKRSGRLSRSNLFLYRFWISGKGATRAKVHAGRLVTARQKPTGKGANRGLKIKGIGKVPGSFVHPRYRGTRNSAKVYTRDGGKLVPVTAYENLGSMVPAARPSARKARRRIGRLLRAEILKRLKGLAKKK